MQYQSTKLVITMKILMLEGVHGFYEELKYASCIARQYAKELREMGHDVKEVIEPTPEKANKIIEEWNPDIIWWVGHGKPDIATLEALKKWLVRTKNVDKLKKKIAIAHACFTGDKLGKIAIKMGANAYLGYRKRVFFVWCNDPVHYNCACSGKNPYTVRPEVWEKLVTYPHMLSLEFLKKYAETQDLKEAYKHSIKFAHDKIRELKSVKPQNRRERAFLKLAMWALTHNKDVQVLYTTKKKEEEKHKKILLLPIGLAIIGGVMIGLHK